MSTAQVPQQSPVPPAGYSPYAHQYPTPHQPRNGMGVAALVLGIVGAVFALIPLVGVVLGFVLGVLAVVLGLIGFSHTRSRKATNPVMSWFGVGLGVLAVIIAGAQAAAVDAAVNDFDEAVNAPPPVVGEPGSAEPIAFGQTWTSSNGNTIVAGAPELGTSQSPLSSDETVVRVPITVTNNGSEEWNLVFTTFHATLDGVPVQESVGEGDWLYSAPLAPGDSVTLTKVFLAPGSGELTMSVSTPHGTGFFTGPVS